MNKKYYFYTLYFSTSENHRHRSVAFLVSDDTRVTAKDIFDGLSNNIERHFRTRFDAWVGGQINNNLFHGWNKTQFGGKYIKCFVFKCKDNRENRRFYGFLCNPKAQDRQYQVCVLVNHAYKSRHETDIANLEDVEKIRTSFMVQKAVSDYFGESKNGNPLDRTKH